MFTKTDGGPVRTTIFHIHRDLRFPGDKTPYRARIHMSFQDTGRAAAWMFALDPLRNCCAAQTGMLLRYLTRSGRGLAGNCKGFGCVYGSQAGLRRPARVLFSKRPKSHDLHRSTALCGISTASPDFCAQVHRQGFSDGSPAAFPRLK